MGVNKVDNRPFKPDKTQWISLGIAIFLIAVSTIWAFIM